MAALPIDVAGALDPHRAGAAVCGPVQDERYYAERVAPHVDGVTVRRLADSRLAGWCGVGGGALIAAWLRPFEVVTSLFDAAAIAVPRTSMALGVWAAGIGIMQALILRRHLAGYRVPGLVIDIDASIVECHSEKENAAPTWKKSFGYYPIFAFLDNTREALAGLLRKGNAGSGTADDHICVLDAALQQIPDAHRYGQDILIRTDSAGCSKAFLAHIRGLRRLGMRTFFSVGMPITAPIRDAIVHAQAWIPALDNDGEIRDGAQVVEITHLVKPGMLAGYPTGTRLIVRRERPHPGAQLDLFDTIEGFRHQVIACDTPVAGGGSIQFLEARHRGHARVEDRIRCGKDAGFGRFPSRQFNINQVWLELALTGLDLIAWTQMLLLDGMLAHAEPKRLRYRLLHTAARIVRTGRRILIRINTSWPWAKPLAQAFQRLTALPRPAP